MFGYYLKNLLYLIKFKYECMMHESDYEMHESIVILSQTLGANWCLCVCSMNLSFMNFKSGKEGPS